MATSAPALLTAPQLAGMDANARAQYFNSLPNDQRAAAQAAYRAFQMTMNRNYMRNTIRKTSVAPQSSGGSLSQVYSSGATLPFTVPSAQNGFLEGFLVRMNVLVTLATGTSAVYAATAASVGGLSLIDNIVVQYNGTQGRLKPYILRQLEMLQGYLQMTWPNAVLAGQHNTSLDNYLSSGAIPTTTGSQQTLTFEFYVPLNALHPQDVRGLLPIMGGETQVQIIITCAPQPIGPDPVLNTWSVVSGTGHAATFANTSTVQVYPCYRDGNSYNSPTLYGLDLSGLGTVQYAVDVPLTGLTANNVYRQKVSIMDKMYWVISTVIDGQQSNLFATNANIAVLEADKDAVGQNVFWKYGTGTNLSIQEYFYQIRNMIGQDLDQGVLPLVTAPIYMEPDAADLAGTHYLDTSVQGWTDFHYGIQLSAIGAVAGITPRVETHVIFVNSAGLVSA